jgi:broad specificity phosphatase PhoE
MGRPFLYVVRHGETKWNHENRIQGSVDIPLSERGQRQAECLAERFSKTTLSTVYASPLSRALDTARAMASRHPKLDVVQDGGLLEVKCGIFEGKTYEDLGEDRRWVKMWRDDPNLRLPQGESRMDLYERVRGFMEKLLARHADEDRVLVVGHGGVNKSIMGYFFEVDITHVWRFFQSNACVNVFRPHDMGYLCETWNDVSHLPPELRNDDQGAHRK